MPATLFLIPNILSGSDAGRLFPVYNSEVLLTLKYFIVETPKNARLLLKKCGLKTPFDDVCFYVLNEHTRDEDIFEMIKPILEGNDAGLITDAGYPSIADPGEIIVSLAHKNNIRVVPLIGPSSVFLALAASGLNAEAFTFHGYIPVKQPERSKKIREFEEIVLKTGYTQVFIETPYRTQSVFTDLLKTLSHDTMLCLAADITSDKEMIITKSVAGWSKNKPDINKRLVVFLIGK